MVKPLMLMVVFVAIQAAVVWALRRAQVLQPIYTLSPASHQHKRTPSMGGVALAFNLMAGTIILGLLDLRWLWLVGVYLAFAAIGLADDLMSLWSGANKGLSARQKFGVQLVVSAGAVAVLMGVGVPLPPWQAGFYVIVMTGVSNATNLTDGLDGLLGSLSLITLSGFALLFGFMQQTSMVNGILMVMLAVGAFLLFNWYPAKVFMGDTGSLALGAFFAGLAMLWGNVWVLLWLGAVYLIETASVMIQVSYFKWTRRRVFLMSPLHHHFELLGLSERRVVALFDALALGFLALGLGLTW
ncbi:MAG: phospho-N-acetylmuramoyl-pentapeptide-transferase [Candidatus Margulisiibacteriota bacterium]